MNQEDNNHVWHKNWMILFAVVVWILIGGLSLLVCPLQLHWQIISDVLTGIVLTLTLIWVYRYTKETQEYVRLQSEELGLKKRPVITIKLQDLDNPLSFLSIENISNVHAQVVILVDVKFDGHLVSLPYENVYAGNRALYLPAQSSISGADIFWINSLKDEEFLKLSEGKSKNLLQTDMSKEVLRVVQKHLMHRGISIKIRSAALNNEHDIKSMNVEVILNNPIYRNPILHWSWDTNRRRWILHPEKMEIGNNI